MKKLLITVISVFFTLNTFAQFATFEPIINEASTPSSRPNNYSNTRDNNSNMNSTTSTTGYVLDESGQLVKRIQIKVSIQETNFGEKIKIVSYYSVNPGFGANWISTSTTAQAIDGEIPISAQQKVAYANFMYWAYIANQKIWFNI